VAVPARPSADTVRWCLTNALRRVETAPGGHRHVDLRNAALTIGGLLDVASLSSDEAAEALLAAVLRAGGDYVDRRNARATIAWGLEQGRLRPLSGG